MISETMKSSRSANYFELNFKICVLVVYLREKEILLIRPRCNVSVVSLLFRRAKRRHLFCILKSYLLFIRILSDCLHLLLMLIRQHIEMKLKNDSSVVGSCFEAKGILKIYDDFRKVLISTERVTLAFPAHLAISFKFNFH